MINWYCFDKNNGKIMFARTAILTGVLLLSFLSTGCQNSNDVELNDILKKGINKDIIAVKGFPLEITNLTVDWANKSDGSVSGEFSVKMKTTEGLYKSVTNAEGLQKLGITDLYEQEVTVAVNTLRNLPTAFQGNLLNAIPENVSSMRFYEVLVPKGGEVSLTGSVELTKSGNGTWQVVRYLVDPLSCGDKFIKESNLPDGVYKLDDLVTKQVVDATLQKRKDFVRNVELAVEAKRKADEEKADQDKRDELERENQKRLARIARQEKRKELIAGAVSIDEAINRSGFAEKYRTPPVFHQRMYALTQYGTDELMNTLNDLTGKRTRASTVDRPKIAAEIKEVQDKVRAAQEKIASTTFFSTLEYTANAREVSPFSGGLQGSITVKLEFIGRLPAETEMEEIEILCPSGITGTISKMGDSITLSVSGNTDSINKLRQNSNHYRVIVWFHNLRSARSVEDANGLLKTEWQNSADILRMEIVERLEK